MKTAGKPKGDNKGNKKEKKISYIKLRGKNNSSATSKEKDCNNIQNVIGKDKKLQTIMESPQTKKYTNMISINNKIKKNENLNKHYQSVNNNNNTHSINNNSNNNNQLNKYHKLKKQFKSLNNSKQNIITDSSSITNNKNNIKIYNLKYISLYNTCKNKKTVAPSNIISKNKRTNSLNSSNNKEKINHKFSENSLKQIPFTFSKQEIKSLNRETVRKVISNKRTYINSLIHLPTASPTCYFSPNNSNLKQNKSLSNMSENSSDINKNSIKFHTTTNSSNNTSMKKRTFLYHPHKPISISLKKKLFYIPSLKTTKYSTITLESENIEDNIDTCITDENIFIHQPKSINYTKQIYTNNYISLLFQFLFNSSKITNNVLSFLDNTDLFHLSITNKKLHDITISKIRTIITNKILSSKHNIHEQIWKFLLTKTTLTFPEKTYIINSSHKSIYYDEIEKDIARMKDLSPTLSTKLFNILNTYSNYNKNIGYAQGLNFIIVTLLSKYINEINVFTAINSIVNLLSFESVIGTEHTLNLHMDIIDKLIKELLPEFYNFLAHNGFNHEVFTANWLITLFSNAIDDNEQLFIIWELIFIFKWDFIYVFIVNIVKCLGKEIDEENIYELSVKIKRILKGNVFKNNFEKIITNTITMMNSTKWLKLKKKIMS